MYQFAVFFKQISDFNIKLLNFDHFDPKKQFHCRAQALGSLGRPTRKVI
jgi:hypothetical protein